jgi:DNA polymerase IV
LLRQLSVELVRSVLPAAKGVRLIGVSVSNFDRMPITAAGELPLFPPEGASSCANDE